MRTALSKNDIAAAPVPAKPDSYTEQILKYIPAEVVAFYIPALATAAALKVTNTATETANGTTEVAVPLAYSVTIVVIFLAGLVGTYIYMYKNAKKSLDEGQIADAGARAVLKALISTIAFTIWALYLGGPFEFIEGNETFGTLGILLFTLISPPLYDGLASWLFTQPPTLTIDAIELETPTTQVPEGIKEVTVTNRDLTEVEVVSLELYSKRWFNKFGNVLALRVPISESVKPNTKVAIKTQLPFTKKGDTHILKIKTKEGLVATSDPISRSK